MMPQHPRIDRVAAAAVAAAIASMWRPLRYVMGVFWHVIVP